VKAIIHFILSFKRLISLNQGDKNVVSDKTIDGCGGSDFDVGKHINRVV